MLRAFVTIDIHHEFMLPSTCFPVDSTILIALHIIFYLFKFGIISDTSNPLDAHLGKVIAHRKQFVSVQHQIGRIDLHVLCIAQAISALHKSDDGACKTTNPPKGINSSLHWSERVTNFVLALCSKLESVLYVSTLKHFRSLINDSEPYREGVFAC